MRSWGMTGHPIAPVFTMLRHKSGTDDEKTTQAANSNEKKADGERGGRGRGRGRGRKAEAHPGELPPPPDCKGDTLHDTGHVPAFLLR